MLQHQTVTGLREENCALREQARQAKVLDSENDKLSRQLSNAQGSQPLNRVQLAELLRREVRY